MTTRTWNCRLNIDALNAAYFSLGSREGNKAEFLDGLICGVNNAPSEDFPSVSFSTGYGIGTSMRAEAEGFRAKQREGGKVSAAKRASKYGTAQPPKAQPEDTSKQPRSDFEDTFEERSNLTTNHYPQSSKPKTDSQQEGPGQGEETSGGISARGTDVLLALPCKDGSFFNVTTSSLKRFQEAFPSIPDPLAEFRQLALWLEADSSRQRLPGGMWDLFRRWGNNYKPQPGNVKVLQGKTTTQSERDRQYMEDNPELFQGVDHAS